MSVGFLFYSLNHSTRRGTTRNGGSQVILKRFILGVLLGLLVALGLGFALIAYAQHNLRTVSRIGETAYLKSSNIDPLNSIIYANQVQEDYEKAVETYRQANNKSLGANSFRNDASSCVNFAKAYLGQTGTWGTGGANLSLNADAQNGEVVIFTYPHVAVKLWATDTEIKIIEANYIKGRISERVLQINDITIKGFHAF